MPAAPYRAGVEGVAAGTGVPAGGGWSMTAGGVGTGLSHAIAGRCRVRCRHLGNLAAPVLPGQEVADVTASC